MNLFSKLGICWSSWMVRALETPPGRLLVRFPARAFCENRRLLHGIWNLLASWARTRAREVTKEFKFVLESGFYCMLLNNYSVSRTARTAIVLSMAMMSSIVVAGINLIFLVSQVSTCHWRVWQEFLRLQSKVHFNQGLISPICLLLQLVIQLRAYFNNPFISWWLRATGHYLDW